MKPHLSRVLLTTLHSLCATQSNLTWYVHMSSHWKVPVMISMDSLFPSLPSRDIAVGVCLSTWHSFHICICVNIQAKPNTRCVMFSYNNSHFQFIHSTQARLDSIPNVKLVRGTFAIESCFSLNLSPSKHLRDCFSFNNSNVYRINNFLF